MSMNAVLTAKQAREITRGRTPLVPVEYESALKSLQACTTLDESKYWADKSDALAAWARIYKSDQAGNEARRLKLHAYRRMGELARELSPYKPGISGAQTVLRQQGLKEYQVRAALVTAKLPQKKFDAFVSSARPPSPGDLRRYAGDRKLSHSWEILTGAYQGSNSSILRTATLCQKHRAKELARGLHPEEAEKARDAARTIIEWLDEFEQYLPKAKK